MKKIIEKHGGMSLITLPEDIAKKFLDDGHKRIICKIDNHFELHCAILRSNALGYYIMMGKKTLKSANVVAGQEIDVQLLPDDTKYQSKLPVELEEVLLSDFEGHEKFHQLTPGKQRSIIYLVTAVKSTDKRIERALKIIENIKMGITANRELLN